jgi:hypothetical protein
MGKRPYVQMAAIMPAELAHKAMETARQDQPGITASEVIRLALARLAGMPDDVAVMRPGRKPRKREPASV